MKSCITHTAAVASQKTVKVRGNMCAKNIQRVVLTAKEAFGYQTPGISFDDWRAEEVMAAVGQPGVTACDEDHFCDLMGHFCTGAGKDDEALEWFLSGRKNAERQIAWSIAEIFTAHLALASSTIETLTTIVSPRKLKRALASREAILDHPDGPLTFDYLVKIVRDKTRRPNLTLSPDLKTSLAERCDKIQLAQIRFTLVNRIAEREGRGHTSERNHSQNSEAAKTRRSPHVVAPRF